MHPPIDLKNPFITELFVGSARVTTCLRHLGLRDSFWCGQHEKEKLWKGFCVRPHHHRWSEPGLGVEPNCAGLFAAPPCGTRSRARDIPLFDKRAGVLGLDLCDP